ncbi:MULTISPECIES: hypothetical protein [unclassified Siphonobacter]|uniref:hypothetical protein n=1 Tax=unclassified Siphonobacter TaxID=2635712 RepID=UPI000CC1ACDE|nr:MULTISPECIES: hypothetical protein [unclassified Siphonobacter]MDQ1087476.1 hypothetical protein [Siphonobacter sp. SORGH_AS_1065]MDR6193621.1 hypothetical protein [Siphonobacter sp. SORGH_AS_0500]PKK36475.1 hypothetical protein BWI96_11490 [Siphonobacter sp. SORGH_AS_0500]
MQFILMILLSAMVQYFLPWWSVMIIPFAISAWKGESGGGAFWNGFLSTALLWFCMAYYEHLRSGGILTARMSETFQNIGTIGLLTLTTWSGALLAGFASMSGYYCRQAILPKVKTDSEKAKDYW